MDPITAGLSLIKVKSFFKKLFTSPWFYVVLAFIAIGVGTYFFLQDNKEQAVAEAVTQADSKATIQSYKAKETVTERTQVIDDKFDALAAQTTKDYANARAQVEVAPAEERDALLAEHETATEYFTDLLATANAE